MSGDGQDATEHLLSTEIIRRRLFEARAQASLSPTVHRSRTNSLDPQEARAILREVLPLVDAGGESLKPSRKAVTALAQFIAAIRHDERMRMMVRMTSEELEEDLYGGSEGSRDAHKVHDGPGVGLAGRTASEDGAVSPGVEPRRREALEGASARIEAEHEPVGLAEVLAKTFQWVMHLPAADRQKFLSEVKARGNTAAVWSDPELAASLACEVPEPETDAAARTRTVADTVASGRLDGAEPPPEFFRDAEDFISGAISGQEFLDRGRRRWGLSGEPGAEDVSAADASGAAENPWEEALATTGGPMTPEEARWADEALGHLPIGEERWEPRLAADVESDLLRLGLTERGTPDLGVSGIVAEQESVPGMKDGAEQRVAARQRWEAHRYRARRLEEASVALAKIEVDEDLVRRVDRVREVLAGIGFDAESQDLWLTAENAYLEGETPLKAIGQGLLQDVEYAARQRGHV